MIDPVRLSIDRLAHASTHHAIGYGAAFVLVGMATTFVEVHLTGLGHGTHLLMLLIAIIGATLLFGPGPGAIGLVAGGAGAATASVAALGPVSSTPSTLVELVVYTVAGTAFIVLVSVAVRLAVDRPGPVAPTKPAGRGPIEALTAREHEVLGLAATGMSVDQIGHLLFVSPNTVKTHLARAYGKLGARNRAEAVRLALHCGCLTPADICPHIWGATTPEGDHPIG